MIIPLADLKSDTRFDIVAIGGGVAGMAAALFGAIEGKRVLLVERTELLGGTSALSAGTTWIPNTAHAELATQHDSFELAKRFLDEAIGNHAPAALRDAFLQSGPSAIATLEASSEVRFRPFATHPDYEQQIDGATLCGRALEPIPFDGRLLGKLLDYIRPPVPEMTIFGGMMVDRTDINHLLNAKRSFRSFAHAARLLGIYGRDRLTRRRGTRLVMGNALIGRFLASLEQRSVPIVLNTSVTSFIGCESGVSGLVLKSGAAERRVFADAGVVLASGGFGRHQTRRAEMLHHPVPEHSPTAPGHTGEMQDLALALGARLGNSNLDHAFWAPVSLRTRPDGTLAVFSHFVMDRSKPGTVCVNQSGERFTNESASYHRFARAMFEANKTSPCIPCFILADSRALRKYGLGMIRMNARDLSPFISDGYLIEAATIPELAAKLGVPADALVQTVAKMNECAATPASIQIFVAGQRPIIGSMAIPRIGPIRRWDQFRRHLFMQCGFFRLILVAPQAWSPMNGRACSNSTIRRSSASMPAETRQTPSWAESIRDPESRSGPRSSSLGVQFKGRQAK